LYASTRSLRSTGERSTIDLSPQPDDEISSGTSTPSVPEEGGGGTARSANNGNTTGESSVQTLTTPNNTNELDPDPNRLARARWVRINRRFQLVITVVALIFSLFLFAILVCWVVLTSAYVVSIDKSCDVPLKAYFWLVTLQLVLDVFRTDIMRLFFRWDANSHRRIPCRVITYNIAYLTYALLVLRLGINSVFLDADTTCKQSAPELFQSSAAFVSLTIAAWSTIVLGYLVPFCCVATLLTWNGYTPSLDAQPRGGGPNPFTVFPSALSGAPPGCVDQLRIVLLEEFPDDYPIECCICMEDFVSNEVIIETECNHVFHKQCCREWLRQARTCPVCRMDIPSAFENVDENSENNSQRQRRGPSPRLGFGPTGRPFARSEFREVISVLRLLRQRRLGSETAAEASSSETARDGASINNTRNNQSLPTVVALEDVASSLEEGRGIRQYPAS
jgi:hypothetical protein